MAIVHTYNGSDLVSPATVALQDETGGFETKAVGGNSAGVTVFVDDPSGALTFTGHKQWLVSEDTAPAGSQVFWAGFVGESTWSRVGNGRAYMDGPGRVWEVALVEGNTYLQRRKLRKEATTTARPSETVDARIAWLLTTDGMSGVVVDAGLVASSSVVMDASTGDGYHNQDAKAVLDDCALSSGFNYHIRYREATDDYQLLFYDSLTSPFDTSSLLVSNVAADYDGSATFTPDIAAKGRINPDRIASGIIVVKSDGSDVYDTDAGTVTAYAEIDVVAPTPAVSTTAAATALVTHLLDQHSTPEERVTCEIEVPAASVTIVKAGQLLSAKFTHGPGWESYRACRATRVTPKRPPNLTQGFYRIGLDLEPAEPTAYTFTDIRLMRPTKHTGDELGYIGAGVYYPVHWDNTGDAPKSGDGTYAKVGLADYIESGPNPGYYTGIEVSGTGTVSIVAAFSISKVTTGPHTFYARVKLNGATVQTWSVTENKGLAAYGWDAVDADALVTSTAVVATDIIELEVESTSGSQSSALPTGTGNGSHQLRVYGYLV